MCIRDRYTSVFENEASDKLYRNPEVMLYLIIELTGSTCYSSILYEEPVPIQELKPYLFQSIRQIIRGQEITGDALETVSYTHLDVYKRQTHESGNKFLLDFFILVFLLFFINQC